MKKYLIMKKPPIPKFWYGGTMTNGKQTNNFNEYLSSWDALSRSIEKLTGLTVTGYDPSINLTKIEDDKRFGPTVQLPLWFAKLLVEKFESLNDELLEEINRE